MSLAVSFFMISRHHDYKQLMLEHDPIPLSGIVMCLEQQCRAGSPCLQLAQGRNIVG